MFDEKKIWNIENCAQQAWTISLTLAQEAARAGEHGRGYAVVAHEARAFAKKLYNFVEGIKFPPLTDGNEAATALKELVLQLKLLTLNAELETVNGVEKSMEFNIPKSMAVYTDNLLNIAQNLSGIAGLTVSDSRNPKPSFMPELAEQTEDGTRECYLLFSIGGHTLIESPRNVKEIFLWEPQADVLKIRGTEIPIFNVYEKLGLTQPADAWQPLIVIAQKNADGTQGEMFAVPTDNFDMGMLYYTRAGRRAAVPQGHAFAEFARDCWLLLGGDGAVFADWSKLRG